MPSKQGRRRRHSLAEKQKGRDKNRLSLAIPITVAVAIVVLGVGLVVSAVGQRPQVAAVPGDLSIPVVTALPLATQPIPYPDVPRMTLKEATEKLERGEAVLVDVRSKVSYDKSHAVGALLLSEGEIDSYLEKLPRDKVLILYCT
jgi:hypothetical protein